MTTAEYQEKIRALSLELGDDELLRQRVRRLFPEAEFEISREGSKLSFKGLTPEQITRVVTP